MAANKDSSGASAPKGKKTRPSPMIARFAKLGLRYDPSKPVKEYTTADQRKQLKALAFAEIGARRLKAARKAIRGIGQLANSGSYAYTSEQIAKIDQILTEDIQSTLARFAKAPEGSAEDIVL